MLPRHADIPALFVTHKLLTVRVGVWPKIRYRTCENLNKVVQSSYIVIWNANSSSIEISNTYVQDSENKANREAFLYIHTQEDGLGK